MNQSQIKYAKERLAGIYNEKRNEIGSVYSAGYSYEEKKQLYNEGKVGIEEVNGNFVIYFEGESEKKEATRAKLKKLEQAYREATDSIVLGNEEQALEVINTFAKGDV